MGLGLTKMEETRQNNILTDDAMKLFASMAQNMVDYVNAIASAMFPKLEIEEAAEIAKNIKIHCIRYGEWENAPLDPKPYDITVVIDARTQYIRMEFMRYNFGTINGDSTDSKEFYGNLFGSANIGDLYSYIYNTVFGITVLGIMDTEENKKKLKNGLL